MRILLIEDSAEKARKTREILSYYQGQEIINLDNVSDIIGARQKLMTTHYNLLIIDLLVPIVYGDDPLPETSKNLLDELKVAPDLNMPDHIIGLTAYKNEYHEYEQYFQEENWFLLNYDLSTDEWEKQLLNAIKNIALSVQATAIEEYRYDLAIICALNEPEFDAVKKLSNKWEQVNHNSSPINFYVTSFTNKFGKDISVIAVSIDKMGMIATSTLATQMIQLFRPRLIAMTGIAAGIDKEEMNYGDIMIAYSSWDSGSGKIKKDKENGGKLFELDIKQETLSDDLYHQSMELKNDTVFLNKVYQEFEGNKPGSYLKTYIGPIASGAAVIANTDIRQEINIQSRKLLGIEMEIYGLYYAAHNATNPKPNVIAIKSVCDFADEEKNDKYQKYAAYTSAKFLHELVVRNLY